MLLKLYMKPRFLSQNITKIDVPPFLRVQHTEVFLQSQRDDSMESYGSQLQDGS